MNKVKNWRFVAGLVGVAFAIVVGITGTAAWFRQPLATPAAGSSTAVVTAAVLPQRARGLGPEAAAVVDWIVASHDAGGGAFVLIDKVSANLYVFTPEGMLRASSPILLGSAAGDDTVPGIGDRPLSAVRPAERTTPAGRFVGERGHNARGEDVVWVDYDAAVSIHRVLTTNPAERRLERLASADPADRRISYGCINVPVAFFTTYVSPLYEHDRVPIYILPETRAAAVVFGLPGSTSTAASSRSRVPTNATVVAPLRASPRTFHMAALRHAA